MEYVFSPEQIDMLLKSFLDYHFDGTTIGNIENWFGIIKNNDILVGKPNDETEFWYTDGSYFNGYWNLFNMNSKDFNQAVRRYVNKRYGFEIKNIM